MKKEKSRIYQKMASTIRERLGGREYVIGVDPGVGSIGIAAVALERSEGGELIPADIVYACSRIFLPSDSSLDRKQKRTQRNMMRHKKNRLARLWKKLAEKGLMLPYNEVSANDTGTLRFSESVRNADPYELRRRGLCEALSIEELGVALYHIAAHRGTSKVRTLLNDRTCEEIEDDLSRNKTKEICEKYGVQTYIEAITFYNGETSMGYRNRPCRSSGVDPIPVPTRDIIENEVSRLLSEQIKHHPDVLTEDYLKEVRDVMFYENPIIIPEVGNCPYFPEEKKAPKASFLNEERRLWEALNLVRLRGKITVDGVSREIREPLTKEEKCMLFADLRKGETLTPARLKRKFPHYSNYEILLQGPDRKIQKIAGFRFRELEEMPFFKALTDDGKERFIELFVTEWDDGKLIGMLISELGISEDDAAYAVENVSLIGDYAPVGMTALKIITEKVSEEELSYNAAVSEAIEEGLLPDITPGKEYDRLPYYGEVLISSTCALDGKAWNPEFSDMAEMPSFNCPSCCSDEKTFGKIRNPVIHQTLNELRKIINELIDIFGKKPRKITVEIARNLKLCRKERDRLSSENASRNGLNVRIFDMYCRPNGLPEKYIRVFRMLEEQNWTCPYCQRKITVSDVVCRRVDVDHIFPYQDTLDTSENNLVVCDRYCNEVLKSNRIPHTAFGSDAALWARILRFLDTVPAMKAKKWRFMIDDAGYREYLVSNGSLPRFKEDNVYAARLICDYLRCLYPPEKRKKSVKSVRGSETSLLRRAWNLNGITRELSEMHLEDGKDIVHEGKDRKDARHHALDAIVAAYYTESYRMKIGTLVKAGLPVNAIIARMNVPEYCRSGKGLSDDEARIRFRNSVLYFLREMAYVSRKIDTDRNGTLVKDTQYQVLETGDTNVMLYTRKRVCDIKAETFYGHTVKSVEEQLRVAVPAWLSEEGKLSMQRMSEGNDTVFERILSYADRAETELRAERMEVTEKAVVSRSLALAGGKYVWFTPRNRNKVMLSEKGGNLSAFDTGDNYSLDLYRDGEGHLKGEVIRKVNLARKDWKPEYEKKGFVLFERLFVKDVLEVDSAEVYEVKTRGDHTRTIRANNAPAGRTFLSICTFTEWGSGIQIYYTSLNSEKLLRTGSARVSGLGKLNARKVVLSPAGLVEYRSELLADDMTNK